MTDAPTTRDADGESVARFHAWLQRAGGRPLFWVVVVGGMVSVALVSLLSREAPPVPPVLLELPEFSLVDQAGEAFTKERMAGRVWIADFIFTHCPTACVTLTERMSKLQVRLSNTSREIQLVSFSVDPDNDTPEVLEAYAKAHEAQPGTWTFVTGPLLAMEQVVVDGFKMAMDKNQEAPADDIMAITHGTKLVLIDRLGRIRGYYDANDADEDRIMAHARLIANVERQRLQGWDWQDSSR